MQTDKPLALAAPRSLVHHQIVDPNVPSMPIARAISPAYDPSVETLASVLADPVLVALSSITRQCARVPRDSPAILSRDASPS